MEEVTCAFFKIRLRCTFTVSWLISSFRAIDREVSPSAIKPTTSISRFVKIESRILVVLNTQKSKSFGPE